jgi:hypothetical protein
MVTFGTSKRATGMIRRLEAFMVPCRPLWQWFQPGHASQLEGLGTGGVSDWPRLHSIMTMAAPCNIGHGQPILVASFAKKER